MLKHTKYISFIKHDLLLNNINNHNNFEYYKTVLNEIYKLNPKKNIDEKIISKYENLSSRYQSILLDNLFTIFNNLHSLNLDKRLWKILIGHWLFRYCNIFISRWHRLNLLQKKKIKNFYCAKTNTNLLLTKDTNHIIQISHDDIFNSYIYKAILKNKKNIKIFELETIYFKKKDKIDLKILLKKILLIFQKLDKRNRKKIRYFFYHTYLNKKILTKLNKKINQKDLSYLPDRIEEGKVDAALRKKLTKILSSKIKTNDPLLISLISNFFNMFPSIYLESFIDNFKKIDKSHWPYNPKLIFTSNSFDTDEYFKFYTINKIHYFKSKYFCGQHGNNCGTFITRSRNVEQDTSDIFFTWGWKTKFYKNHIKLFNFRQPILNKSNPTHKTSSPLFILDGYPHDINLFSEPFIFDQKTSNFLKSLNTYFRNKKILIKKYNQSNIDKLIPKMYQNLNIKFVKNYNILNYLKENEIFVFLYDSTGFLEMINLNKPCLMFIDTPLSLYYENAIMCYKKLISKNIIFDDYEKLFAHLNKISNNVESWWNSGNIQNEIDKFRKVYSSTSSKPIEKLVKLINKHA